MKVLKVIFICFAASAASHSLYAQRTVPANYTGPVNYVKSWDVTAPIIDPATVLTAPNSDVKLTTQYIDGLARPFQTVVRKGSLQTGSAPTDMVAPQEYDDLGREAFKYLPYPEASANTGTMKAAAFANQASYMSGQFGGQGETWFYNQTNFEASPLNRPAKQMAAGNSWVGAGRGVSVKYWNNTSTDAVKKWDVSNTANELPFLSAGTSSGNYTAGELIKTITLDEHDKQVIEFKDKDGKVILKKVQLTGNADDGSGQGYTGWLCTYYIYDIYNNLRCVVQPRGVELLASNSWDIKALGDKIRTEQCFLYAYDTYNRMTIKKVPGAGEVRMVYDKFDRLVMMQDANMRTGTEKWLVTKYDNLNRPVETGLWENSTLFSTHLSTGAASSSYPTTSSGYTSMTITHYDNYSSLPAGLSAYNTALGSNYFEPTDNANHPYKQMPAQSTAIKGSVAWTQARVIGTATFLNSVTYYDAKGRVIEVQTTNLTGGTDVLSTQYTWSGQPYITVQQQTNAGNGYTTTIVSKYWYDELNRLVKVDKQQKHPLANSGNMSSWKTVAENIYDKQGQLLNKKLSPGFNSGAGLESMNYEYNIRGWMLGANRAYARNFGADHYFGFDLGYDKTSNGLVGGLTYSAAQYNGNITGTVWKSKGDQQIRRYDFRYDNANRILKAGFTQYTGSTFDQSANVNYDMSIGTYDVGGNYENNGYDANGNIKRMVQYGLKLNSSSKIDDLSYTYDKYVSGGTDVEVSNKLMRLMDAVTTDNKLGDFKDGSSGSGNDYTYDGNGNLSLDNNKAISSISYNHLNLPAVITVTGKGTITYKYDAVGNKLQKITNETSTTVIDGGNTYPGINVISTTDYMAGFVFESKTYSGAASGLSYSNKLQFAGHEEGRIRALYYHATQAHTLTGFAYDYMLKDHLGNVRSLLTDEGKTDSYNAATMEVATIAQEEKFYANLTNTQANIPSGGWFADPWYPVNAKVAKLRNTSGSQKVGPNMLLKVMAGDSYNIRVASGWNSASAPNNSNTNVLADLLSVLSTGMASASGGKVTALELQDNASGLNTALSNFMGTQSGGVGKPKAYINWVLLDEQFQIVKDPFGSITGTGCSGSDMVGSSGATKIHAISNLTVSKSGYLYIYTSNESQDIDVFFDNLQVTHNQSPILEETHYYPFGLTMAGISSQAVGTRPNNEKTFQDQRFDDDLDLNWVQFKWRNHDPQIGRFIEVDPLSEKYTHNSTYAFSENKVIAHVELEGLEASEINGMVDVDKWGAGEISTDELRKRTHDRGVAGMIGIGITLSFMYPNQASLIMLSYLSGVPLNGSPQMMSSSAGSAAASVGDDVISQAEQLANKARVFQAGGEIGVLENMGNLKVDKFTNRIGIVFNKDNQTVMMNGDIIADGETLAITNFHTETLESGMAISGQNTVGPAQFLKLKAEVETILKAGGYSKGSIQFQRSRVEGSPLTDSELRTVNLNLK